MAHSSSGVVLPSASACLKSVEYILQRSCAKGPVEGGMARARLSSTVRLASSGTQHQCSSGTNVMKICEKYTNATKNENGIIRRNKIFWYKPNSPTYGNKSSKSVAFFSTTLVGLVEFGVATSELSF
ncbi:unnamed protein product [Chrysodeixis includens]|uniref:Uncharacterized protein n=1 Tax=Chrysodeixis includens TaxID=689277 RepID=A0A9N8L6B1_CHRIL|nr:unnamed protein product [Chrysodeixis includens]